MKLTGFFVVVVVVVVVVVFLLCFGVGFLCVWFLGWVFFGGGGSFEDGVRLPTWRGH